MGKIADIVLELTTEWDDTVITAPSIREFVDDDAKGKGATPDVPVLNVIDQNDTTLEHADLKGSTFKYREYHWKLSGLWAISEDAAQKYLSEIVRIHDEKSLKDDVNGVNGWWETYEADIKKWDTLWQVTAFGIEKLYGSGYVL